jgi:thioesterase domain-containing protein
LRSYQIAQNLKFHWDNLVARPGAEGRAFLERKLRVSLGRALGRLQLAVAQIPGLDHLRSTANSLDIRLTAVNDLALLNYKPKPYSGQVIVFRPNKLFKGEADPDFGWRELVGDNLRIHVLPVAPRGMLVEPFARMLARRLTECIDESTKRVSERLTHLAS